MLCFDETVYHAGYGILRMEKGQMVIGGRGPHAQHPLCSTDVGKLSKEDLATCAFSVLVMLGICLVYA